MKKVFITLGVLILVVITALMVIPTFFKGDILQIIEKQSAKYINAKLKIGDMNLSMFKSFPNLNVALKEVMIELGENPEDVMGVNSLQSSIEVKLKADYANTDSLAVIEKNLRGQVIVSDILYQKDLIQSVNDNMSRIGLVLLALAIVLMLISFALISNTIRLGAYSKRFLIHTMKLVGASWAFIRRPFLRRNFWIGVLSAVIADAVLWGAAYWLVSYEPELIRVITPDVMLLVSVSVLIFGVLITWLCALLSINKYLKTKAGTLYYI